MRALPKLFSIISIVVRVSRLTANTGTSKSSARLKRIGSGGVVPVKIRQLVEVSKAAKCKSVRSLPVTTALFLYFLKGKIEDSSQKL
jgi:hypothetical protein